MSNVAEGMTTLLLKTVYPLYNQGNAIKYSITIMPLINPNAHTHNSLFQST